jgi:hypothetical protein
MPDNETITGIAEPEIKKLKVGNMLQMERIGFGRVEGRGREVRIVFAHR